MISGAAAYAGGQGDAASVGLKARGQRRRGQPDAARGGLPGTRRRARPGGGPAGSGPRPRRPAAGQRVRGVGRVRSDGPDGDRRSELIANPHFWAGPPAITNVSLVTTLAGSNPVDAFQAGDLDWTPVFTYDAPWIAYDKALGPQLRQSADLSVLYYGFDTTSPPFDNVHVRRAFARAVDWRRIVQPRGQGDAVTATSMVPPGIPDRSDTDFGLTFDAAAAKQELASAGFTDPATFPAVTLVTSGTGFDGAIVAQLRANLGITVNFEGMTFGDFFDRLGKPGGPRFWAMSWIADYPSPNDFLGILLGSGQPNNYGHWTNAAFDAAITQAVGTTDDKAAQAAYDAAQAVVRDEVPVIPVTYGTNAALSRTGLLGATTNGLGILRIPAMAWATGNP